MIHAGTDEFSQDLNDVCMEYTNTKSTDAGADCPLKDLTDAGAESQVDISSKFSVAFRPRRIAFASIIIAVPFLIRGNFTILLAAIIGATIPTILFLISLLHTTLPPKSPTIDLPRFHFLVNFNKPHHDEDSLQTHSPLIENSEAISNTLNSLIELVVGNFVEEWYTKISPSLIFVDIVRSELQTVVKELSLRAQRPNAAIRIVKRCIPALRDHFDNFVKADMASRKTDLNSDVPYHAQVELRFNNGKLHPALCRSDSELKSGEKMYLKDRLSKVATLLLLESSRHDDMVNTLVTEILSCTIACNVISLLSDSDYIYMLMIKVIGDNLKHRGQAKQLRAALEQHSRRLNGKASMMSLQVSKDSFEGQTTFYTISPDVDLASVKEMVASISRIHELTELYSIMQYVISQLRAISVMSMSDISRMTMIERLQLLKKAIETREKELHSPGNALESPESLLLTDILNDARACQYYSNYLKEIGKHYLFDFWSQVQQITVPLEYETTTSATQATLVSLEFSTIEDMRRIHSAFYEYEELVATDPESFGVILAILGNAENMERDHLVKCRLALLKAQSTVFQRMNDHEFVAFKESQEFRMFKKWYLSKRAVVPKLTGMPTHMDTHETHNQDSDISSDIHDAVESELSRIMQASNEVSNQVNTERASLFEKKSISSGDSSGKGSLSSVDIDYCLFDDLSEVSDSDSESTSMGSSLTFESQVDDIHSQIHHVSPGTLNFAHEISTLTHATHIINDQIELVKPLIKKAELSNNTSQLKVLRRSLASLEQESVRNQMQIQQLVIQRDENSLFKKTKIWIQLYVKKYEGNRQVISYVVEIQRVDPTNDNLPTAGWILGRRFSHFYRLHEYLKTRYPQVAKLPFPSRTVHILNAQQRQITEKRKTLLESYLQSVIEIPDVCDDAIFRSFLSSEEFLISKARGKSTQDNSATDSHLSDASRRLFQAVSPETFTKMQKELHDFEEAASSATNLLDTDGTFVRPICDLLMSLFNLNSPRAWLRGRALVVLLQRVLGTTIDHKVEAQLENLLTTENSVNALLNALKDALFPDGKFRETPPPRTAYERRIANQEARALLHIFMSETCAIVFGSENTSFASSAISRMILVDLLNKQFAYQLLDIILEELFPEITSFHGQKPPIGSTL